LLGPLVPSPSASASASASGSGSLPGVAPLLFWVCSFQGLLSPGPGMACRRVVLQTQTPIHKGMSHKGMSHKGMSHKGMSLKGMSHKQSGQARSPLQSQVSDMY